MRFVPRVATSRFARRAATGEDFLRNESVAGRFNYTEDHMPATSHAAVFDDCVDIQERFVSIGPFPSAGDLNSA